MTTPQEARDAALERVEAAAHEEWLIAAADAVTYLAAMYEEFDADAIWALLRQSEHTTHEPRAMGAVLRNAARDGMIAPTDRWVQSRRTACHGRPIRVWRSLLSDVQQAA
jgi:hypothetical protein